MGAPTHFRTSSDVLDHYVASFPTAQNAIDSVPGWTGAMPPDTGLRAGASHLYADTRIAWLLNECFQVAGKSVLELGPLEGFHTYMLDRAGAASIEAVEANTLAFVRCLITKEVLNVARAHFFLGDFSKWLEADGKRYDLVVASGVLYHSHDPVRLLELIGEKADAVFLWTHYFDEAAMPKEDRRRVPFSEAIETRESHGVTVRLHERSYYQAWRDPSFCGGFQDRHFWIDRGDILQLLAVMGFGRIVIAHEEPAHINGPSFSIFAQRVKAESPPDGEPTDPAGVASGDSEPTEAESVQAGAAVVEPATVEPAHVVEPAQIEPGHAELAHDEPVHVEAAHAEPVQAEAVHAEPVHVEPVQAEPVHVEPSQGEPASASVPNAASETPAEGDAARHADDDPVAKTTPQPESYG